MVDLQQLHDAQPNLLVEAGDAYDTLSAKFAGHVQGVADIRANSAKEWSGNAAFEAQLALMNQRNQLDAAHTELVTVGSLLRDAAGEFQAAQSKLLQALADAEAAGYTVAGDGTVTALPPGNAERHDRQAMDVRASAMQSVADRVARAVRDADSADQRIAGLLDQLAGHGKDGTGLNSQLAGEDAGAVKKMISATLPPASASAKSVNEWWKGLPPVEQQLLIQQFPDLVGNRDGIPAAARDQANRLNLTNLIDQYAQRTDLSDDDQLKLDGFRAIQQKLDASAGRQPPAFLIGVGDEGQGRGILSWGNPDTARNVSAYVPGLGTTLSSVGGKDADRALNVWKAAKKADPTASTASIVWLGYDPPPGLDSGNLRTAEVVSTDRASRGAASYDRFLGGLHAAHDGSPAHVTALGHSYGSLTVGLAGQLPGGTGADDMILVGSPGTGAQNASQLGIRQGHTWVGAAEDDPVSHLPSPDRAKCDVGGALIGGSVAGPTGMLTGARLGDDVFSSVAGEQLYFGRDPASAGFGANRFAVADGPSASFASHSNYMNDPTEFQTRDSITNVGQIVAGQYDNVTRQAPR